jgi:hypothetical protein
MDVNLTKEELETMIEALVVYKNRLKEIDDRLTSMPMPVDDIKESFVLVTDISRCNKLIDKLGKLVLEE